MNILDTIIEYKAKEVALAKAATSIKALENRLPFSMPTLSLKANLLEEKSTGIIAEFKRKSPSKGIINDKATVKEVTNSYTQNGAAGISVLTDNHFFGGSLNDLEEATVNKIPLLRKDFVIDEYQIIEAKAYGASVILLIAACLTPKRVSELANAAKNLGLEVLLEIHNEAELEHICDAIDFVGVNNRNLKDFVVNLDASVQLIKKIPSNMVAIAESGINNTDTILFLRKAGFKGFLIGEHFMKQNNPAAAFGIFVSDLKLKG